MFGDSLMKGTLPDAQLRHHFHTDLFEAPLAGLHAEVTNRSVFGATSRKGVTLVQRDLARGHRYDWALVEYGGNDCNYDWPDVAAHPEQDHDPVVLVDEFRANMAAIVQMLREAGIRPIFTTLPPIDEVKYLACIDHNGASAAGVMQWLGDVRRIYRTQERYSGLVRTIADELDVPCVDPRERFLDRGDPARSTRTTASTCRRQGTGCFTARSSSRCVRSSELHRTGADTAIGVRSFSAYMRQAACVRASRRAAVCASA
ncbi:MAG: SGNH/GDSL hydrolase family protein [Oscillospiraceae bacterium]